MKERKDLPLEKLDFKMLAASPVSYYTYATDFTSLVLYTYYMYSQIFFYTIDAFLRNPYQKNCVKKYMNTCCELHDMLHSLKKSCNM